MWVYNVSKLYRPRISDGFLADTVDTTRLESSCSCYSALFCALHDQLASLDRHTQLTRCFSAVAELLVCGWSRRTIQQIQRCVVESSCISSTWHELRLQVCRWYGRLLLETLTVHGWTSCRMSIRLAVCRHNYIILRVYKNMNSDVTVIYEHLHHRRRRAKTKGMESRSLMYGQLAIQYNNIVHLLMNM